MNAARRGVPIPAARPLTTEALANQLGVKPQTLRAAVCRNGHYCGIRPFKGQNRFLYWPSDAADRIILGEVA